MRGRRLFWALLLGAAFCSGGCRAGEPPSGGQAPQAALQKPAPQQGVSQESVPNEPARTSPADFSEEPPARVLLEVPRALAPGARAELVVRFVPGPHVLIPIYPPAYADSFETLGGLRLPAGRVPARELSAEEEEQGRLSYYDGPPPDVRVPLEVPAATGPGSYPVAGQAHYFYCDDEGGFCAKKTARVEGVIDVLAPQKEAP